MGTGTGMYYTRGSTSEAVGEQENNYVAGVSADSFSYVGKIACTEIPLVRDGQIVTKVFYVCPDRASAKTRKWDAASSGPVNWERNLAFLCVH